MSAPVLRSPTRLASHSDRRQPRIALPFLNLPVDVISQIDVGEIFVHRNIANQVVPTDNNLQVSQRSTVEVLRVPSIAGRGREECGGIAAEQVYNLRRLPAIQPAVKRGWPLEICGWVYGMNDGLLRELDMGTPRARAA